MSWNDILLKAAEERLSPRIVGMEAIQLGLLDAIYRNTDSTGLAFQGGTCLRLVYGGLRYSEDLDFVSVAARPEPFDELMRLAATKAEQQLATLLGPGEATLGEGKTGRDGRVRTWWFRYVRQGDRQVLKVKLELGSFPAHDTSLKSVRSPLLPFLPPPMVVACSPRELLADKLNAVAQRPYIKGRDLYDIWYLTECLHTELDTELVERKFQDYGTREPRRTLTERLKVICAGDIAREMERFVPKALRQQLEADGYVGVLEAVRRVVERVLQ